MKPPEVFISYAWQGESEKIAVEIEKEFGERGLKIIRDKTFLEYTGRIKAFMEKIGQGQYIILVISDRYLRSQNCLYELLQIYKAGNFTKRIFPLILKDAHISKAAERLDYVHYWEKEIDNLEAKIKQGRVANLHGIYEDLDLYSGIRQDIDRLTAILKDINALTIEMHRQKDYDYLYQAIMKRYRHDNGIKQIKILALTASPEDGQGLNYELEQDLLLDSFKGFDRHEVFLDMPDPVNSTLQEMAERLNEDRHDILLISAHGGMNDKGEGILSLEDDGGGEVEVTGQELAAVLNAGEGVGAYCNTPLQEPPLSDTERGEVITSPPNPLSDTERGGFPQIVILSACHTAREGQNLVPVAQALFKAGIQTVIGMKDAITNEAAIAFNIAFFYGLNDNLTVKEAFRAGKQAIEIYEQAQVKANPQYKYRNEAAIPQLLTADENLTRKDFNEHVIEAPPPPQSHQFLGAQYRERGFIGRRRVLRQMYRQIEEKSGALVLKGPGGIGKSTLTTRLAGQLTREGYDFIVIQGQTSEAAILQALGKKGKELGITDAEAIPQAQAEAKDKLNWFLEHLLLKHRLLVIFDNFESNQLEAKAGEFGSESLKEFLHYFTHCLEDHESLLLFSSRYRVPGIACLDIGEFSDIEFRKMVFNGKALGRLDGQALTSLREKIGGSPRAIELLDTIAREEFGTREITWQMLAGLFPELGQRLLEEHHKDDFFAPLFLNKLLGYLGEEERRVLDRVAIFRVAVAEAGPLALGAAIDRKIRRKLADLSLLEYRANDGLYYCHRLTAGYVLDRLAENVKKNYHRAAAGYFSEIFDLENKGNVDDGIEARWHYLQGQDWDEAAKITFALERYLTVHGYPFQSFDLLQEIAEKPLSEKNRAVALGRIGSLYQDFGQYDQAIALHLQVKDIFDVLGDQKNVAVALHQVGMIYEERGDYDAALGQYQKSLEIEEKLGNKKGVAQSLHQVGMIYEDKGDYDAALGQYRKSLEIKEQIGDIKGEAQSLHQVGIIYQLKGDYDAALGQYRKSLEIKEQIGDIKGVSNSLGQIALLYYQKGDYEQALEKFKKSIIISEKIGDIKTIATTLHNMGMIYQMKGDYDAALGQYQKSLEIKEKIGDISGVAKSLHQVGRIYEERGDYDAALDQYRKSLAIKEKIGDISGIAISLHQVGRIYEERGDYDGALDQYRKSLEIREKIGDVPGKAISLGQMGKLYIEREDYPTALGLCLQSLAIFQKLGSPNAKIVMRNIASLREKMGEAGQEKK